MCQFVQRLHRNDIMSALWKDHTVETIKSEATPAAAFLLRVFKLKPHTHTHTHDWRVHLPSAPGVVLFYSFLFF